MTLSISAGRLSPMEEAHPAGPHAAAVDSLRATLAADGWSRNVEGGEPAFEADLIRNSGLARLTLEPDAGQGETGAREDRILRWIHALGAVRAVARTDMSSAALLGYNYMHLLRIHLSGHSEVSARAQALSHKGQVLWGGANNPNGRRAEMVEIEGQGFRLNGQKFFATGAQTANHLVIGEEALRADGEGQRLTFILDACTPGLEFPSDWKGIGARRSASSSIQFRNVFVPYENIFSQASPDPAKRSLPESLGSLAFQMLFINFFAGNAEGMVETVIGALSANGPGRKPSEAALRALGDAVTRTRAAGLMADRANAAFAFMLADLADGHLDWHGRGAAADIISQAKVFTDRTTQEVANRLFEAGGARVANESIGLDRYWSDARMFAMHDGIAIKECEIGEFALWTKAAVPSANS